ncbi:MAG: hypothetical protein Q8R00_00235 [Candidatus Nanoarchaeia archaeon]|nr:hypothetical protein [Candidatus Nanoarchaeia archaeon]
MSKQKNRDKIERLKLGLEESKLVVGIATSFLLAMVSIFITIEIYISQYIKINTSKFLIWTFVGYVFNVFI